MLAQTVPMRAIDWTMIFPYDSGAIEIETIIFAIAVAFVVWLGRKARIS